MGYRQRNVNGLHGVGLALLPVSPIFTSSSPSLASFLLHLHAATGRVVGVRAKKKTRDSAHDSGHHSKEKRKKNNSTTCSSALSPQGMSFYNADAVLSWDKVRHPRRKSTRRSWGCLLQRTKERRIGNALNSVSLFSFFVFVVLFLSFCSLFSFFYLYFNPSTYSGKKRINKAFPVDPYHVVWALSSLFFTLNSLTLVCSFSFVLQSPKR